MSRIQILFFAFTALFLGPRTTFAEVGSLKIGVLLEKSDKQDPFTKKALQSLRLLLDSRLREGQKIQVIVKEDLGLIRNSQIRSRELIKKEKVQALILLNSLINARASTRVAKEHGVPVVSPIHSGAEIEILQTPIIEVKLDASKMSRAMGVFAREKGKNLRVALLQEKSSDYSKVQSYEFQKSLGPAEYKDFFYSQKGENLDSLFKNLKEFLPHLAFIPDFNQGVAEFLRVSSEQSLSFPFFGGSRWSSVEWSKEFQGNLVGHYFPQQFSLSDREKQVEIFREEYSKRFFEDPDQEAALIYDGFALLLAAWDHSKRKARSGKELLASLRKLNYPGVSADFKFKESKLAIPIMRIQSKRAVFLKRVELAL